MDAQVKEKWVAALRSGNYQQARNGLKKGGGYCCLGVLCDIVNPDGWENINGYNYYRFGGSKDDCALPIPLENEVGLGRNSVSACITLNDTQRQSFDQIADYIEKNL
jgi:hypothetical protein